VFNELSIVCMGTKDCIVVGTKNLCVVVVTIFVVVTVVGTKDVVIVSISFVLVVGRSRFGIAEGDGKAARRIAATIRTLTRCAVFTCMLVHAHDTSTFLSKYILVQESFRIVQENSKLRFTKTPILVFAKEKIPRFSRSVAFDNLL
jgi:hypothetical protein